MRKNMKKYIVASVVLLCYGCVYAPWQVEQYVVEKGVHQDFFTNEYEFNSKYKEYKVSGALFDVFIKAHNQTTESGKGPYIFYATVYSSKKHSVVEILDIKIKSDVGKAYVLHDDSFPIEYELKPFESNRSYFWDGYQGKSLLDFDFNGNERITMELTVRVGNESNPKVQKLFYTFKPLLKKGDFKWLKV